jgi:hypothetical protein
MIEYIAVVAPMLKESVRTAVIANPGERRSCLLA